MKRALTWSLLLVVGLAPAVPAQTTYWPGDSFDTYPTGYLCCASSGASHGWDGWLGNPNSAAYVANGPQPAHSGANYLRIFANRNPVHALSLNAAASTVPYNAYPQSGYWELSVWIYVPTGGLPANASKAVFYAMNAYTGTSGPGTSHAAGFDVRRNNSPTHPTGADFVFTDVPGNAVPFSYDQWHEIRMHICLDAGNWIEFWFDGVRVWRTHYATLFSALQVREIAGLDIWSQGSATFHLDSITLAGGACPAPDWMINSPAASLDADGLMGDVYTPAVKGVFSGQAVQVNLASTLAGSPYDLGVVAAPLVSALFQTPTQTINLDLSAPSLLFLGTGTGVPGFNLTHPGMATLPVTIQPAPPGFSVSAQMAVLDPGNPDGAAFSQGVQLDHYTCSQTPEGFESPDWSVAGPLASGWSTPPGTLPWTVWSGPTPHTYYNLQQAQTGSQFIYANVTQTVTGTFGLETASLSTAGVSNPALTFGRNAFGPGPGPLAVQQEDPSNPGTWIPLATLTGGTGILQGDPLDNKWVVHQVPLLPATGATARFQFIYTGNTSNSWLSGMALDDVGICEM